MAGRFLIPARPEHLGTLCRPEAADLWADAFYRDGSFFRTVLKGDDPVACLGVLPVLRGRATCAALLSASVNRYDMLWLTRRTLAFLNGVQADPAYRRIETTVLDGFRAGHRWAVVLGFSREGLMRRFDAEGRDHVMYARIAEDC